MAWSVFIPAQHIVDLSEFVVGPRAWLLVARGSVRLESIAERTK
jgi:hypothetical protein